MILGCVKRESEMVRYTAVGKYFLVEERESIMQPSIDGNYYYYIAAAGSEVDEANLEYDAILSKRLSDSFMIEGRLLYRVHEKDVLALVSF